MLDVRARLSERAVAAFTAFAGAGFAGAMEAIEANGSVEMLMYGIVGDEIRGDDVARALARVPDGPLTVRINSPGGLVDEGLAIHNMLRQRGDVTVQVDGIAASAAAFIAVAADRVLMGEQSLMMIHNCHGGAYGNRHTFLDLAATMEKIDAMQAEMFAAKSQKDQAAIVALLDAETYFTAPEAIAFGLADAVVPTKPRARAQACGEALARERDHYHARQRLFERAA